jgi:Cytoskeletal-regulatory complex EF hand
VPQPQEKKAALKVILTDKEKGYYSNLLMQADPSGNNKVAGP